MQRRTYKTIMKNKWANSIPVLKPHSLLKPQPIVQSKAYQPLTRVESTFSLTSTLMDGVQAKQLKPLQEMSDIISENNEEAIDYNYIKNQVIMDIKYNDRQQITNDILDILDF